MLGKQGSWLYLTHLLEDLVKLEDELHEDSEMTVTADSPLTSQ